MKNVRNIKNCLFLRVREQVLERAFFQGKNDWKTKIKNIYLERKKQLNKNCKSKNNRRKKKKNNEKSKSVEDK